MKFLLRTAFWLALFMLLLPSHPSQRTGSAPQVSAGGAVSAASAAVADMRQFCARQPDACVVGSQAVPGFGQITQTGTKVLSRFFAEHFAGQPVGSEKPNRTPGRPPQNTLSPVDLAGPWRGSPARKEAEAKRPA